LTKLSVPLIGINLTPQQHLRLIDCRKTGETLHVCRYQTDVLSVLAPHRLPILHSEWTNYHDFNQKIEKHSTFQ
jgi:hypothetical protein